MLWNFGMGKEIILVLNGIQIVVWNTFVFEWNSNWLYGILLVLNGIQIGCVEISFEWNSNWLEFLWNLDFMDFGL